MTQKNLPSKTDKEKFYQDRLASLGLTEETPGFFQEVGHSDEPFAQAKTALFYPDEEGNLVIPYFDFQGDFLRFKKTDNPGNPMTVSYQVKRLIQPEEGQGKYDNPKGYPNQIYLTPNVILAHQRETVIDTLYIVEGQFKALAGWAEGLHMVGITGFWGWKKGSKKPALKDMLEHLLERCTPKNVVLLLDSDCRLVSEKYVYEGRDLAKRLSDFHRSVRMFGQIMNQYPTKAYFAQVHEAWAEVKGLDDLLQHERQADRVVNVLSELFPNQLSSKKNTYFQGLNLSESTDKQLEAFFFLNSVNLFYDHFKEVIGVDEFTYKRGKYRYIEESGKVDQLAHPDLEKFIRVGTTYYKRITHISQMGETRPIFEPWQKGEISEDYGKKFISKMDKYDAWTNRPANLPQDYRPRFEMGDGTKLLNMYSHPPHTPQRGPFPTIWMFLKHVFGTDQLKSGYRRYVLAIDWLTILYQEPTHKLPIICLVSEEKETGKSTFIDLLMLMLGDNVVRIGNDDIADDYNAHYISKLVAGIEEGLIEKEAIKEKLKALSTSPNAQMHAKFSNKVRVDCLLKFIITSNKPTGFIRLEENDERFFVVQVPRIKKKDPDLVAKMEKEIPAFLYFLSRRKVFHKRVARMWFAPSVFKTPEFYRAAKDSLPSLQRAIIDMVRNYFWDYDVLECHLTAKEIRQRLDIKGVDRAYLKKILVEKMEIEEPRKNQRRDRAHTEYKGSESGRFYSFYAKDFLSESELIELEKDS